MVSKLRIGLLDWVDILIPAIEDAIAQGRHAPENSDYYYLPREALPADDNDRQAVTSFFSVLFEFAHLDDPDDEVFYAGLQDSYSIDGDDPNPFSFIRPEGVDLSIANVKSVFEDVKVIFQVDIAPPRFLIQDDPDKVYIGPVHKDDLRRFDDLFSALAQYFNLDALNNVRAYYDWVADGPVLEAKDIPPVYAFISRDIYSGFFENENRFKAFPRNADVLGNRVFWDENNPNGRMQ